MAQSALTKVVENFFGTKIGLRPMKRPWYHGGLEFQRRHCAYPFFPVFPRRDGFLSIGCVVVLSSEARGPSGAWHLGNLERHRNTTRISQYAHARKEVPES